EINYFSLTVDDTGNFIKTTGNQTDPGWREWNSEAIKNLIAQTQIMGGKFSVTIVSQRNTTMENILSSKQKQQTLIDSIINQVNTKHLDGVNIDFEYDGTPDEQYQQAFTEFSKTLSETIHKEKPQLTLSLSIMPLAIRE